MPFRRKSISINEIEIHLIFFQNFIPEEYYHLLNSNEQDRLLSFHHVNRKREFIATRLLKKELFGDKHILYESHGAPYIQDEGFISISHTSSCSAIAVCSNFRIGLDLEKHSSKAARLQSKFLNKQELVFLDSSIERKMTAAWSCKESMYKLAGRKKIIFKTELLLQSNIENKWEGQIINPDEKFFVKLLSIDEEDFVITINTSEIERIVD